MSLLLAGNTSGGMGVIAAIVIIYMIIVLAIGAWATKRTKSSADFFIAGKSIGPIALALAAFSATMSGWLFVGCPGLIYSVGTGVIWLTISTGMAYVVLWAIVGKRMRLLVEISDCMTVADAVYVRYKSRLASGLSAVATIAGTVLYLATQLLAMGVIIGYVFNISVVTGLIIGMVIMLIYAIGGGMLAGVYTDVFQGAMMVIASVAIFIYVLKTGNGMFNITEAIANSEALAKGGAGYKFVGPFGLLPPITAMSYYFIMAMGVVGQPHLVHKFFMIKDIRRLKWGAVLTVIPAIISGFLAFGVGIVVKSLVVSGKLPALANPDDAITVFLLNYTNPVLTGIAFAGIASAVMSTGDSFVNIASAAVIRDLPFAFGKTIDSKKELMLGRIASIGCGILSVGLAVGLGKDGIALLGAFGWGTFAAALAPVVGLGFNWKRATKEGAISSIVAGLGVSVLFEMAKTLKAGWYMNFFGKLGLHNGSFALGISLIVFIVVSLLTTPAKLDKNLEAVMDC